MKLHVINGPNLNLLGKREPEIYGETSWDEFWKTIEKSVDGLSQGTSVNYFQSNHEGELLDYIHQVGFEAKTGIVLNAGALSHTSIALGDAVAAISAPVLEVHISNVYAREAFRHNSYIASNAIGSITGLHYMGYIYALHRLYGILTERNHLHLDLPFLKAEIEKQ
jgi:3-dehydroquinate dehydratase-2